MSITEDAPPESSAWRVVRLVGNPARYMFRMRTPNEQIVEFVVPVQSAAHNEEDAARIARLCYDRLAAGATERDVLQYRDGLLSECLQSARAEDVEPKRPRMEEPATATPSSDQEPVEAEPTVDIGKMLSFEARLRANFEQIANPLTLRMKVVEIRDRNQSGKLQEMLGLSAAAIEYVLEKLETEFRLRDPPKPSCRGGAKGNGRGRGNSDEPAPRLGAVDATGVLEIDDCIEVDDAPDPAVAVDAPVEQQATQPIEEERRRSAEEEQRRVAEEEQDEQTAKAEEEGQRVVEIAAQTVAERTPKPPDTQVVHARWKKLHPDSCVAKVETAGQVAPQRNGALAVGTLASPQPISYKLPKDGKVCAKMMVRAGVRCVCHYAPPHKCPLMQEPDSRVVDYSHIPFMD